MRVVQIKRKLFLSFSFSANQNQTQNSKKPLDSTLTGHGHEARGAGLRQPVALHDGAAHADRQEVLDVPRERRAAADDEPDPPSQPLLELGEDQLVEEGRRAGQLDAGAQGPQLAPVAPVEQQRLDPAGLGDLGRRPRVDPVEDPRDAEEERGPERSDVVDQVLDVAFLGFFYS